MGLLNRYEKIRMDKDAILKAESRNRSGGKKRMNRTIRVSAAGDILIMKRLLPGYQDVLPIREFLMQGEVRMANLETTISDGSCYASAYSGRSVWKIPCVTVLIFLGFRIIIRWIIPTKDLHLRSAN